MEKITKKLESIEKLKVNQAEYEGKYDSEDDKDEYGKCDGFNCDFEGCTQSHKNKSFYRWIDM